MNMNFVNCLKCGHGKDVHKLEIHNTNDPKEVLIARAACLMCIHKTYLTDEPIEICNWDEYA